jgi:hypothetical protein
MVPRMKAKTTLRPWINKYGPFLASIFLVYHFGSALVLPNADSYLERTIGAMFYPYANTLGFHTPWQFFSPNPSRHVYFEYEVQFTDKDSEVHRWPPESESLTLFSQNLLRLVYHSRFTTSSPERKHYFLVAYLCDRHEGAENIGLQTWSEEIPSLERAAVDVSRVLSEVEKKSWPSEIFDCDEATAFWASEAQGEGE